MDLLPFLIIFLCSGFPVTVFYFSLLSRVEPVEGLGAMNYVGLENYHIALTDPWLWRSLKIPCGWPLPPVWHNTCGVTCGLHLGSMSDRLRHWLTSAYFLPFITSTVPRR
ncbi:Maltose/maltodextrin ABC transporter, permease protein MalF [Vibrio vulnificus]|nr:Maltose/maltodextrin ABC transporter, permease protein MalF [Vibrio vulnificus]